MAQQKRKTVWACDVCTKEHATYAEAEACAEADKDGAAFQIIVASYKAAQGNVRAVCKHAKYKILASEDSVDMTDSRCTNYTKMCNTCDKVWIDHYR